MDWFERLTGFREREYSATQSLLAGRKHARNTPMSED